MSDSNLKLVEPEVKIGKTKELLIYQLVKTLIKHNASDLHIKAGRPPLFRINGKLMSAKTGELSTENVKQMLFEVMNPRQMQLLEKSMQVDFSFIIGEMGRFRANVFIQRGTVAGVIRTIPSEIPDYDTLGLPPQMKEVVLRKSGLVLVTGATGSGKSTTLAALIKHINHNKYGHIVTIEDPIEFVHRDKKCSISQREIGTDAVNMHDAVVGSLRQDPDVITIGEMRNIETISAALTAAETGHLVLSTLHTSDAPSSVERILDIFPPQVKDQARVQLSSSLAAVLCQRLVNKKDGTGRIAVCEYMVNSPTIQCLIRDNEIDKIHETMNDSTTYYHMQTFNQALEQLVTEDKITVEEAIRVSHSPDDLRMRLEGFKREEGY